MVRKRSRRYSKVDSDESDSDDFYEENSSEEAQPKKYSLRQRRSANFVEDFDYDLIEESEANTATTSTALRSDDEEFDVKEAEIDEQIVSSKPRTSRTRNYQTENDTNSASCTITKYKDRELEPEIPTDRQSSEDMIDFEDVIRADILVNKSRIDYDSIIEKTEIKLEKKCIDDNKTKLKSSEKPIKYNKNGEPPKKRGRKPKQTVIDDTCYENVTNETESTGLPINSVLGVTESLYELAERYHMQGGSIEPLAIMKENISLESTESGFIENENEGTISLQEPENVSEAIEIF
ncbi:hypothetical protein WA026_013699 [Henosepilachna vigintioctopunctata]|uniref:Uncharacterized protein n=1 Tax=Henosepilachna vigintioctopunctata TaxID=420089 RepID=A0AAW1V0R1_9CUCU